MEVNDRPKIADLIERSYGGWMSPNGVPAGRNLTQAALFLQSNPGVTHLTVGKIFTLKAERATVLLANQVMRELRKELEALEQDTGIDSFDNLAE